MVQVLNRTSKYTTIKIDNNLFNFIFGAKSKDLGSNATNIARRIQEKKEYIESETEKTEILKIKKEMLQGKFVTLKDFLLQN